MHDQVSSSTVLSRTLWEDSHASVDHLHQQDDEPSKNKKGGQVLRKQEELCHVCGDRASGYHYNALTCEGCKGFFRRSITKNAVTQCKYGNNCQMDMYMRRKCQECRLKKCLQVGMKPECVVPAYQCAVKQNNRRTLKGRQKPNSTSRTSSFGDTESDGQSTTTESERSSSPEDIPRNSNLRQSPHETDRKLTDGQQNCINLLVALQDQYEQPSPEELQKFEKNLPREYEDEAEVRFREVTQMALLTVKLIVEFSKRLPGFVELRQNDQIALLKACSCEVMMLRTARRYHEESDTIIFANNVPYTRENYYTASIGATADPLFNFCRRMCNMKVDNAEYALITAVVIFSDRPGLSEPWKVEQLQEFYLTTLQDYIQGRHPIKSGVNFAKLLGTLTELRTLGKINSEMCFAFKLENKNLPELLNEMWNETSM